MAFNASHSPKSSLFIGLLCLSILFLLVPHRATQGLSLGFKYIFAKSLGIGKKLGDNTLSLPADPNTYIPISDYNQLWKEYETLQARIIQVEQENLFLSRIRQSHGLEDTALLISKITLQKRSPRHEAFGAHGSEKGVAAGQFVLSIDKNSVIGIVKEVSEKICCIQLLTDAKFRIEVRIRRNKTKMDIPAQMFGDGKNGCKIGFIQRKTDIKTGDIVYAAPQTGQLTTPIVIGSVSKVIPDEQNPLLWTIEVRPIEDLSQLSDIVILIPEPK